MRKGSIIKKFGVSCTIITYVLAATGAVVAVIGAFTKDVTIVGAGFSAMCAAIWMLWKNIPIKKI